MTLKPGDRVLIDGFFVGESKLWDGCIFVEIQSLSNEHQHILIEKSRVRKI
jgi:hypothetical protein